LIVDFVAQKHFERATVTSMKIENVGAIKAFTLPANWHERSGGSGMGVRWEKLYQPNVSPSVELIISYRGVPLDEASRKVISFLFKQGEKDRLTEEEILALRTVMGVATNGDNQVTNKHDPDSIDGPGFNLQDIRVKSVNGKMVLHVEGKFKNGRFYTGMFYQAGSEGKMIEEFYLQSASFEDFDKYHSAFEEIAQSIVWK
jgi:hypothetical protein